VILAVVQQEVRVLPELVTTAPMEAEGRAVEVAQEAVVTTGEVMGVLVAVQRLAVAVAVERHFLIVQAQAAQAATALSVFILGKGLI
jgi:hypothetical protein